MMSDDAGGRAAYIALTAAPAAEYDALPQTAQWAFRAFAVLSGGDAGYAAARQVALDARRDAVTAGLLTTTAIAAAAVTASTDPNVRNQRPVGSRFEDSGRASAPTSQHFDQQYPYRPRRN